MASPTDKAANDHSNLIATAFATHIPAIMEKGSQYETVVTLGTEVPGIFDKLMTNLVGQGFTNTMKQVGAIFANGFSEVPYAARLDAKQPTEEGPTTPGGGRPKGAGMQYNFGN